MTTWVLFVIMPLLGGPITLGFESESSCDQARAEITATLTNEVLAMHVEENVRLWGRAVQPGEVEKAAQTAITARCLELSGIVAGW